VTVAPDKVTRDYRSALSALRLSLLTRGPPAHFDLRPIVAR
jgi:hypothetical protein